MKKRGIVTEVTPDTIKINGFIIFEPGGEYHHVYAKEEFDDDYEEFENNIFKAIEYCIDNGEPNTELEGRCYSLSIEGEDCLKVNGLYVYETTAKGYIVCEKEDDEYDYEEFEYPVEAIYYCCMGERAFNEIGGN